MNDASIYTLVAFGAARAAAPAFASQELAQKNNFLACHAVANKVVGPAYKDVAAKYKGQRMPRLRWSPTSRRVASASGARCRCRRKPRSATPTPRRSRNGS